MSILKRHRKAIEAIAKNDLDLETLDTRNSDSLDFHDLAVWEIRKALESAFRAGLEAGQKAEKRYAAVNASGKRVRVTIPED